jgi:hypothetical protein
MKRMAMIGAAVLVVSISMGAQATQTGVNYKAGTVNPAALAVTHHLTPTGKVTKTLGSVYHHHVDGTVIRQPRGGFRGFVARHDVQNEVPVVFKPRQSMLDDNQHLRGVGPVHADGSVTMGKVLTTYGVNGAAAEAKTFGKYMRVANVKEIHNAEGIRVYEGKHEVTGKPQTFTATYSRETKEWTFRLNNQPEAK